MRNARVATLAYVAIILLLFTTAAVAADDAAVEAGADPAMTVDEATPLPEDTPTPEPTPTPSATPTPPAGAPEATVAPAVTQSEGNNAARRGGSRAQRTKAKAWEAKYRCLPNPSRMLARGGTAAASPGPRSLAWLAYVIAGTCALLVLGGFVIRRRSEGADAKPGPGLLEVVATVIGLCATATGLLTWFAPDLAARATPASKAEMTVQSVNTRIAHGEFVANEERGTRLRGTDRRGVGNVIWLNLHLVGYRGKELTLQWGSFEHHMGGGLIAATSAKTTFTPPRDDVVQFLPVWVGYPNVRFRVEFRLLQDDGGHVVQMAETGPMTGALPRYACQDV
jgi:hypothetical protein